MHDPRRLLAALLAITAIVLGFTTAGPLHAKRPAPPPGEVDGARFRLDAATAKLDGAQLLTPAERAATFRFAPSAPADRAAFLGAVAAARPQARRLIGLVDGLVTVRFGPAGGDSTLGTAAEAPDGYDVTIDLGRVAVRYGQRGIDRVVLHELGHVVDFALLPDELTTALDSGIPQGWGCDQGRTGACANREERFAETFAKWATGDIGVDLYVGYKVPPPPSLDVWGAPLARFGA